MTLGEAAEKIERAISVEWAHVYNVRAGVRVECELRGASASNLRAIADIMDKVEKPNV